MAALLTFGCGDSGPTAPTAPPNDPPSPTDTNRAPSVFVRGGGESCHPLRTPAGVTPCTLRLTAYAQDPDNDPLTYSWSGCAVGERPGADCVINAIGPFTASVKVSDGCGGMAESSVELAGVNRAPAIDLPGAPAYLRTHSAVELYGVLDDDDAVCRGDFFMDVEASGACGPYVRPECRGGPNVVMIELRTHDPGTCNVSVRLRDAWGVTTVTPFSFEVEAP
jgi:hypothetical protein